MKTKEKKKQKPKRAKKDLDAVKLMREIRNKVDKDIADMSFEEELEYFKKGTETFRKTTKSSDNR